MGLSPLQELSIAHATSRLCIWDGSVRSGKTIASLLRWLMYVARAPRGGQLVVSGKTTDTISRNIFGPLTDPEVVGTEIAKQVNYTRGAPTAMILGRLIDVISANDSRSEGRLRGMTCAGAYVDEATLVPEEFFTQLLARLSVRGAQLFATTNPDSPGHWLRKKFLLRSGHDGIDLRHWHFTLDDNPALDPAYVRALKAEYTGLWYRRFILGEWCMAEGAIYEQFDDTKHVVTELPSIAQYLAVGVDYGTVNPFAAILLGLGQDGRLYVTNEWRYDSKLHRRQLTDHEYSEQLRGWLTSLSVQPTYTVVDPSASSFITQLYRDGLVPVAGANSVIDGIRAVANLFATDRLRIHVSCTGLIEELPGYSWDDAAQALGVDQPIKADDHSLDALRYGVYTTQAIWQDRLTAPSSRLAA